MPAFRAALADAAGGPIIVVRVLRCADAGTGDVGDDMCTDVTQQKRMKRDTIFASSLRSLRPWKEQKEQKVKSRRVADVDDADSGWVAGPYQ
eukprot:gene18587-47778_t